MKTHLSAIAVLTVGIVLSGSCLTVVAEEAGAPDATPGIRGKVAATIDAGRYTYVQVAVGTNLVWAAAPRFVVKVGDTAMFRASLPMKDFHSPTLNRTFELVYFAPSIGVTGHTNAHARVP